MTLKNQLYRVIGLTISSKTAVGDMLGAFETPRSDLDIPLDNKSQSYWIRTETFKPPRTGIAVTGMTLRSLKKYTNSEDTLLKLTSKETTDGPFEYPVFFVTVTSRSITRERPSLLFLAVPFAKMCRPIVKMIKDSDNAALIRFHRFNLHKLVKVLKDGASNANKFSMPQYVMRVDGDRPHVETISVSGKNVLTSVLHNEGLPKCKKLGIGFEISQCKVSRRSSPSTVQLDRKGNISMKVSETTAEAVSAIEPFIRLLYGSDVAVDTTDNPWAVTRKEDENDSLA